MSAETEAIIRLSSYVHDIASMTICQIVCFIVIAVCVILLTVDRFIK